MTPPATNLVEMNGVKLTLSDKVILESVDLTLANQEVLVVMGLSGCGKSTLLGILTGLLTPDAGSVLFKGEDLTQMSRPSLNLARTHIGMVFQNAALMSSLTVGENVALPL
jgi:phospholipid/cholesterol/gamma-HCH transport system ATP-binding protein